MATPDLSHHRHYCAYKPYGMLSQLGTEGYRKKRGLAELFDFPKGVQPVGRLDEDSEGLLLLTSDTKLSVRIRSAHIEKEYWVQVDGEVTEKAMQQMRAGVTITKDKESYLTLPAKVRLILPPPAIPERVPPTRAGRHRPCSWVSIILTEGRYRQVRKMTAAVGFPTLRLLRIRIGDLTLSDMIPGEVREISGKDMPASDI